MDVHHVHVVHKVHPKKTKAGRFARPFVLQLFNETLRPRVAEREVASAISTEARPFARSTVVGSEVGTKLKGLDQQLTSQRSFEDKKGALRPFVAVFRPIAKLGGIYITFPGGLVTCVTKFTCRPVNFGLYTNPH